MTEWKRWRDDPDAPEELRALFVGGEGTRGMTTEERARARARVTAMVGAGATGLVLASAWARALASGKVIGVAAVVTVATATAIATARSEAPSSPSHSVLSTGAVHRLVRAIGDRTRPTPPPRAEAPMAPSATASSDSPTLRPVLAANSLPMHPRRTVHQAIPVAPDTAPTDPGIQVDPLVRESELVDEAMRAVGSSPAHALLLADRHAREFPRGQLVAERSYVRVRALARLGRTNEAMSEARALIEAHPQSEYAARLSRLLESGGGLR